MSQREQKSVSRRVIARFSEPVMAHLARAKLENEGIPAYVRDAHTIGVQWLYSIALGGVRVEVEERDAERALALLEEDLSGQVTEEHWYRQVHPDLRCPRCGSDEILRSGPPPRTGLRGLLDRFSKPPSRTLTCRVCGRTWTQ
jgi:hypothetical protein